MQEPELLEQMNMATGVYEGVAAMRVREALAASARISRARASADGAARPADSAAAEVVRLLDRASDLYAQVCLLLPALELLCRNARHNCEMHAIWRRGKWRGCARCGKGCSSAVSFTRLEHFGGLRKLQRGASTHYSHNDHLR